MANVNTTIRTALGQVFDVMKSLFIEAGTECHLVKQSATLDEFEIITTLRANWFFEWSDFRQSFILQIAESATSLNAEIIQATHIQFDNGAVYVIQQADTVAPTGSDVTWKLFAQKFTQAGQYRGMY